MTYSKIDMTFTHKKSLSGGQPFLLIIVFTILQLLVTLLTDGFALSFDEAMWHYIGRNWFRHGLEPYTGGIDNKSPLIFGLFGLSDQLFGVNYWFPRVLGTLCQSVGIYYVYKIAKQISGNLTGILAMTLYGLALLWRSTGGKYVAFTETYAVTFIIISFYHFLIAKNKRDFFVSGLVAGLSFGFRFSAGFGMIAIFISCLRKNIASASWFVGGVLTSIVVLAGLWSLAGISLSEFYVYAFADNFTKGSTIDRYASWKIEEFVTKFFYSEIILFYPALIGYFLSRKKHHAITIWLICEFIGINVLGLYSNQHLKNLLPSLSVASALAIAYLIETYKVPYKPILLIIWICFFPKVLEPLVALKKLVTKSPENSDQYCHEPFEQLDESHRKMLGFWIKENTAEKDRVLVAGFGAQIQAYSERLSPTNYFNVTQTSIARQRFFEEVNSNKPEVIAIPRFAEYNQLVDQEIRIFIDGLITQQYYLDTCKVGYSIYRLKL